MTAYSVRQKTRPGKPPKKVAKTPKGKPANPQRRHNARNIPPFGRPAK
jgi:hypothetical protein